MSSPDHSPVTLDTVISGDKARIVSVKARGDISGSVSLRIASSPLSLLS